MRYIGFQYSAGLLIINRKYRPRIDILLRKGVVFHTTRRKPVGNLFSPESMKKSFFCGCF